MRAAAEIRALHYSYRLGIEPQARKPFPCAGWLRRRQRGQ